MPIGGACASEIARALAISLGRAIDIRDSGEVCRSREVALAVAAEENKARAEAEKPARGV